MADTDRSARDVARPTRGLARVDDLVAGGVPSSTIADRVARGVWERPLRGVVDVTGERWTWERRVQSAVLACPDGTVASHRTAGALHDLPGLRRGGLIEVTTIRSARSRGMPFRVHSTTVEDHRASPLDGVPTSGPERTVLGLAASGLDDRTLHRATRALLRSGALAPDLSWWAALHRLPGAARIRPIVEVEASRARFTVESPLEELAVDLLLRWGLPPFTTQHVVVLADATYRLDIAWPERSVGLEVDGAAWHGDALSAQADLARHRELTRAGWCVVHATAHDLRPPASRALRTRLERALWLTPATPTTAPSVSG